MRLNKPPALKPVRASYTAKWSDPHDIYRGNTNHWSIMRVEGETKVARAQEKEREAKQRANEPLPVYPGCSEPAYVWSLERAQKLRGHESFYDLVRKGLGGVVPGDLSKDRHKNYNKALIRWPPNIFSTAAQKNVKYWPVDPSAKQLYKPKFNMNKLSDGEDPC